MRTLKPVSQFRHLKFHPSSGVYHSELLICIFLILNMVEHFFIRLLSILIFFLWSFIQVNCPFLEVGIVTCSFFKIDIGLLYILVGYMHSKYLCSLCGLYVNVLYVFLMNRIFKCNLIFQTFYIVIKIYNIVSKWLCCFFLQMLVLNTPGIDICVWCMVSNYFLCFNIVLLPFI